MHLLNIYAIYAFAKYCHLNLGKLDFEKNLLIEPK